jgi:pimeloyl-ACP methyl ester carboxylesterase
VLLLNAGMLHRVGPNRVHVRLARRLAAAGFVVMRFDYSGIGDSRPREDALPFAASAVEETRQAMDFLAESRGVTRFVLFGICSGADNALRAAGQDPRVVGAALIDSYNLPTVARVLHMYANRLLSLHSWRRLLTGRSFIWSSARTARSLQRAASASHDGYASLLPSREEYVAQVSRLAQRGASLYLLYTGESPGYVNYRRLLRKPIRRWPWRNRIRVEYLRDTDHVFTLLGSQDRLLNAIEGWLAGLSSSGPGDQASADQAPAKAPVPQLG